MDFHLADNSDMNNLRAAHPNLQDPIGEALFGKPSQATNKALYEQAMASQQQAIYDAQKQAYEAAVAQASNAKLQQLQQLPHMVAPSMNTSRVRLDIEINITVKVNNG
jgi:hypothetical protein